MSDLFICNCVKKKWCIGINCQHSRPHEEVTKESHENCTSSSCYGEDEKYHRVHCIPYIKEEQT